MFYAATRKDGGLKPKRATNLKQAAATSPNNQMSGGEDAQSLSDQDLDDIFLDNSGGTISHNSLSTSTDTAADIETIKKENGNSKEDSARVRIRKPKSKESNLLYKLNENLIKRRGDFTDDIAPAAQN